MTDGGTVDWFAAVPLFRIFSQAALEIITILCYTNRNRTVGTYKGAKQYENNRGTAQRAQVRNDGKVL